MGYDPARSLGNPVYEFSISFLQLNQSWFYSNFLNLSIACLVLWRLPIYFPDTLQIWHFRLLLMVLPWFWEAATSSMETILALWLWLECGLFIRRNNTAGAWLFWLAASFTRPEYFLVITFQSLEFWKRRIALWCGGLALFSLYLYWVLGKNPVPFHDFQTLIWFYGGRIFTLFRDPNVLIILSLVFFTTIWKSIHNQSLFSLGAFLNLGFFCVFPFEWAYLLPFLVMAISKLEPRWKPFVFLLAIATPFLQIKPDFTLGLKSPLSDRLWKMETNSLAQEVDFQQKTLLLYGATWLPSDVKTWKKSMQNRLFHRTHSNFYVGEKINSVSELDSLKNSGFQIVAWKEELGDFKKINGKVQIPDYVLLIDDVEFFLKQNTPKPDSIKVDQ